MREQLRLIIFPRLQYMMFGKKAKNFEKFVFQLYGLLQCSKHESCHELRRAYCVTPSAAAR